MRTVADKFAARNEPLLKNSKHVGDIDSFNVKSDGKFFSLWNDDEMIALLKLDVIPNAHVIVDDLWVKDSFRGKKILSTCTKTNQSIMAMNNQPIGRREGAATASSCVHSFIEFETS